MSQEFDAIYENGVFRPLERVNLPDKVQVHLQVQESGECALPASTDEVSTQKADLRELLVWIESRQSPRDQESVSARDHDRVLYGWQK